MVFSKSAKNTFKKIFSRNSLIDFNDVQIFFHRQLATLIPHLTGIESCFHLLSFISMLSVCLYSVFYILFYSMDSRVENTETEKVQVESLGPPHCDQNEIEKVQLENVAPRHSDQNETEEVRVESVKPPRCDQNEIEKVQVESLGPPHCHQNETEKVPPHCDQKNRKSARW